MQYHKLFLMAGILIAFAHNNCISMDEQKQIPQPIALKNGLLTMIPWISSRIEARGCCAFDWHIAEIVNNKKERTLTKLMETQNELGTSERGGYIDWFDVHIFCPTIVQIDQNSHLINHGSFDLRKHKEAELACANNQAVFYSIGQGVIVYAIDPEINLSLSQDQIKKINIMAADNYEKPIR